MDIVLENNVKRERTRRKSFEGYIYTIEISMTSLKRHLGNGPLTISVRTVERWFFSSLFWEENRRLVKPIGPISTKPYYIGG